MAIPRMENVPMDISRCRLLGNLKLLKEHACSLFSRLLLWIWSHENVPTDRGITLGVRRKVRFDLCFNSQIPLKQTWLSILLYICKVPSCPGGKRLLFCEITLWNNFYFFDMTAPGSRVQAVGEAPGDSRGTQEARDL